MKNQPTPRKKKNVPETMKKKREEGKGERAAERNGP